MCSGFICSLCSRSAIVLATLQILSCARALSANSLIAYLSIPAHVSFKRQFSSTCRCVIVAFVTSLLPPNLAACRWRALRTWSRIVAESYLDLFSWSLWKLTAGTSM